MDTESFRDSTDIERDDIKGSDMLLFSLAAILTATNNFLDENKLGKGGLDLFIREFLVSRLKSCTTGTLPENSATRPFSTIYADIEDPAGTPYENGVFRMKLLLSRDFQHSPPKVVRCLPIEPFPESALNEQAGKLLLENYEEYARHARLCTEIHALKPIQKLKPGAISESTAANVDQPSSVCSIDRKHVESGMAVPTPLTPSLNTRKGGSGQDHPTIAGSVTPTGEIGVGSGSGVASPPMAAHKKECGSVNPQADKKKVDAKKKSLKRL